uniref:CSC1-like protein 2 n=1 Tax=Timema poppense TaxID=170557 RepID=A0A7R9CLA5_TIMPO|nr:unnamed protein product [Timema poppensis]
MHITQLQSFYNTSTFFGAESVMDGQKLSVTYDHTFKILLDNAATINSGGLYAANKTIKIVRMYFPTMAPYNESESLLYGTGDTDPGQCNYLAKTHGKYITSVYEGIPENLVLNFMGWLLLLVLFAVLRKKAWNYGRIALVQKNEENRDGTVLRAGNTPLPSRFTWNHWFGLGILLAPYTSRSVWYRWTQLFYGAMDDVTGSSEADSVISLDSNTQIDKGFCSWLTTIFRIKDESILQKCGPDAVQYLSFQRHILFYMSVMMVISLGVVLPINFQGTLQGDETNFGHTTLSNLDPNSPWLWVHVTLAILYLPLGIIIMRRFSITLKLEEEDAGVSRTLMITNIPRTYCDTADLQRHFREKNYQAKLYCENHLKRTGVRLNMRPYLCGNACKCCGCRTVDAIEFYSEEESRFRGALEDERTTALKKPLGIAFVTLTSIEAAQKMYADHRPTCKCENNPSSSSVSRHLEPHRENLSLPSKYWYVKAVIVNLFLFIVLFFLTTPAIVVNFLKPLAENGLEKMSAVVSEFLPTAIAMDSVGTDAGSSLIL